MEQEHYEECHYDANLTILRCNECGHQTSEWYDRQPGDSCTQKDKKCTGRLVRVKKPGIPLPETIEDLKNYRIKEVHIQHQEDPKPRIYFYPQKCLSSQLISAPGFLNSITGNPIKKLAEVWGIYYRDAKPGCNWQDEISSKCLFEDPVCFLTKSEALYWIIEMKRIEDFNGNVSRDKWVRKTGGVLPAVRIHPAK